MGSALGRPNRKRSNFDGDDAPVAVASDDVFPSDVLREIFLRLPAKDLCRLRVVCRSWRSLTSDPTFAESHSRRHPVVIALHNPSTCTSDDESLFNYLSFHKKVPEIHFVDLASGDIVRRITTVPRRSFHLSVQLDYVCFSVYKAPGVVLDTATGEAGNLHRRAAPASPFILGFIPSTGELKVLRFRLDFVHGGGYGHKCYAMTFDGDGGDYVWRELPRPRVSLELTPGNTAIVGGVAYFLSRVSHKETSAEPDSIASLDLATEEWRPSTIRGPVSSLLGGTDPYYGRRKDFRLAELNGSLVMVHYCMYQDCCLMDIWFLVDIDKGVWSRRYSVQCEPEWVHHREFYPVAMLNDGRLVMSMLTERVIRMYDPRTSTWATVMVTGGEEYAAGSSHVGRLLYPATNFLAADI
ncbi:unnamed protein product [Urochloa decumbens]|uniref:F-box domain-containing protein n=1 Tax=Urochloa decumbens TaxID=240449 RepID=A0ABC9FQR3_9POAL